MTEKGESIQPSKGEAWIKSNRGLLLSCHILLYFMFYTVSHIVYIQTQLSQLGRPGTPVFTGLANYRRLLNDAVFFKSIFNTVFIALLAMAPQMIFGLILAFLLNQHRFRGGNLFKTIFIFQTS